MKSVRLPSGSTYYAHEHNALRSDAVGAAWLHVHQQLGALALGTAPSNNQTVTFDINGTNVLFNAVTGTPTNPGDVKAPGTAAGFVANLYAALINPTASTPTYVALSAANAQLVQYLGFGLAAGGTTITPYSLNTSTYAPLTSFSASTTVTSGSWTPQTMQLYVEPGTYYINGTRYLFLGGSTPTVTGPVSNPRIDVLTIDTSGTLAWTTGTENASPAAPSYPSDKMALCELYNVVSETALYDVDNQQTGQGYISNDVRPAMSIGPILTAIASNLDPDATDTRNIGESSGNEWQNIYAKNIYAASIMQIGGANVSFAKFGGTGADGALSITSGTTTLSFGSAQVLVKNYSSISITGTGALAFSNPNSSGSCAILKCSGNCTITSTATAAIYVDGMGSAGGTGSTSSEATLGTVSPAEIGWYKAAQPTSSGYGNYVAGSATVPTIGMYTQSIYLTKHFQWVFCGSGGLGATYDGGSGTTGSGGAGGGALVMEIAGALNFGTGATISAQGKAGGNDTIGTIQSLGGGGGGGGSITILYNTLTANNGTLTAAGGANTTGTGSGGTKSATCGGSTPFAAGQAGSGNYGATGITTILANTEFA